MTPPLRPLCSVAGDAELSKLIAAAGHTLSQGRGQSAGHSCESNAAGTQQTAQIARDIVSSKHGIELMVLLRTKFASKARHFMGQVLTFPEVGV